MRAKMWDTERTTLLRQIPGIGQALSAKLALSGIKTFQASRLRRPV